MNRYRFFPARKGLLADSNGVFRMWRSLFYSVGIGLFALGLQALVVEHVTVPKNTKFQKLVKKILEDDKPAVARNQTAQPLTAPASQVNPSWTRQAPIQNPMANQSYGVNTGSRFGPSRFSGPAYGTGYGGPRVDSVPTSRAAQFNAPQLRGSQQFQNGASAQLAGYNAAPVGQAKPNRPQLQKILIREWMPWSLLASGAIIFLYTHTHHRRRHAD